jgi:hypothetical protein
LIKVCRILTPALRVRTHNLRSGWLSPSREDAASGKCLMALPDVTTPDEFYIRSAQCHQFQCNIKRSNFQLQQQGENPYPIISSIIA